MNAWLQQAALWTWQNSLAAAAMAAAIMGIRCVFRGRIAPLWLCLAGWLVLVRLWLPAPFPHAWAWDRAWATPASPVVLSNAETTASLQVPSQPGPTVAGLREDLATAKALLSHMREDGFGKIHPKVLAASGDIKAKEEVLAAAPEKVQPGNSTKVDWRSIMTWIWLAGAAGSFAWTLIRHRRFARRLTRTAKPLDLPWQGVVAECAATAGLSKVPPLFTVPGSGTPFLCGLFRPRIILPSGTLEMLTAEEARHVLLHEMLHIRRCDLAANWLLAVARALHWFNPLVHFICRRLLADRELLRDHQAIALLHDPAERTAYGQTLLKLALPFTAPAPSPGLAPLFRSEKELKRRLTMIQSPLPRHRLAAALATVTLTALSTAVFTTARGQEKPQPGAPGGSAPAVETPSASSAAPAGLPGAPEAPLPPATPKPPASPSPGGSISVEVPGSPAGSTDGTVPGLPGASLTSPDGSATLKIGPSAGGPGKISLHASKTPTAKITGGTAGTAPGKTGTGWTLAGDAQPLEDLRSIAAKLRANGQTAEADAIEEALKKFPVSPKGAIAMLAAPAAELQQLRAEMADVKSALAKLTVHVTPADLEDQLMQLRAQLDLASGSGFGNVHPKIQSLKGEIKAMEARLAAMKKAEAERQDQLKYLERASAANDSAKMEHKELLMKAAQDAAIEKETAIKREIDKMKKELAESASAAAEQKALDESVKADALKKIHEALKNQQDESKVEDSKIRRAEAVKDTDQAGDNLPWGVAVPGKKGMVYSPYTPERSVVDVSGFEKRSKVKCPYTGNFFRVP
jgi:beta-lactamase regulating signal transducer with metallopeptidase domain